MLHIILMSKEKNCLTMLFIVTTSVSEFWNVCLEVENSSFLKVNQRFFKNSFSLWKWIFYINYEDYSFVSLALIWHSILLEDQKLHPISGILQNSLHVGRYG